LGKLYKEVGKESTIDKNGHELPGVDTVLVVDDEDNWCYVTKILLQDTGVVNRVLTANNGLEALKKLQTLIANGEKMPELIILDIKMPVMDGFGFLENLTKMQEIDLSHTKIYITTSSFLFKDKERAKLYPISGYITKPLTEEIVRDILG
jgi:CheY-like chemotaxis protein